MKGRVKWWSEEQGYGFIEYNDNENVFAHVESEDKNHTTFFVDNFKKYKEKQGADKVEKQMDYS